VLKKVKKQDLRSSLSDFVINWNFKYPLDFWWRKKYGVSFGSKEHRDISHFDMLIDFMEGVELRRWKKTSESNDLNETLASLGHPVNRTKEVIRLSKKDIDQEFDDLDLSQFGRTTVNNVEKPTKDE